MKHVNKNTATNTITKIDLTGVISRLDKLELQEVNLSTIVNRLVVENDRLRDYKHKSSNILQSHDGKINLILDQQANTTTAIEKLTEVVQNAINKIGMLEGLKSMMTGAAIIIPPTVGACYFLFKWYLATLPIK